MLKYLFLLLYIMLVLLASPILAEETPQLVDLQAPRITIMQPVDGETIKDARPWLQVEVLDQGSGINQEDIYFILDGVDVTGKAIVEHIDLWNNDLARGWRVRYQAPVGLAEGEHRVQIDVSDRAGNTCRQQWYFNIETTKPEVSWEASLNNSLNYSFYPLQKFNNTINFSSWLQLPVQRFSFAMQASAADYPGLLTVPNLGDYYLHLDHYTVSWQAKQLAVQYGNINPPFDSGLLRYGLGFKGISINNSYNTQNRRWNVFQGTTAKSAGLGVSLLDTGGGFYRWQTESGSKQVYLVQMKSKSLARVMGFQGERVFPRGLLQYELIYGQMAGRGSGAAILLQGGANLAGIHWTADCILLQDSYPLLAMSPLSSARGGGYQYTLRGDKLLAEQKQISFAYSRLADNLDESVDRDLSRESLQLDFTGRFSPEYSWLLSYRGGLQESYTQSAQQIIKLAIEGDMNNSSWGSSLSLAENDSLNMGTSRKQQWNISYSKPFARSGIKTTALLQLTNEDRVDSGGKSRIEVRATAEKEWFQDLVKSYLIVGYKTNKEDLFQEGNDSESLDIESDLHIKIGKQHTLQFNAGMSFWRNNNSTLPQGRDYSFNLSWHSRLF